MSLTARPSSLNPTPIRITRATVFRGHPVDVGETFPDATGEEAATLIGCGKAVRYTPPVREVAAIEPRTETASIGHASEPAFNPADAKPAAHPPKRATHAHVHSHAKKK